MIKIILIDDEPMCLEHMMAAMNPLEGICLIVGEPSSRIEEDTTYDPYSINALLEQISITAANLEDCVYITIQKELARFFVPQIINPTKTAIKKGFRFFRAAFHRKNKRNFFIQHIL